MCLAGKNSAVLIWDLLPRRIGQGLSDQWKEKNCEGSSLHQTPPFPPPSGKNEDLDVLGDLENFTIANIRT